ncbi:hypothetical protein EGH21_21365 [Halomicroarcula sp. F13]|uniref:SIR2-like protein n=1 Tax=Haloarcula rubra TaxID=2487747 RepID=A0AAW4PWN7_9EURY|nr:hypothetical protein [Halomicroarcula rubra]MBX0325577.1 hypothetical protein [Halomicroarcula rubra]
MVQNLILVGAGASYGAGDIVPNQPPLGGGLFAELESTFPNTWGALPEHIKNEFRTDFEEGMVALSEFNSKLHAPLYQAMGAYFAQFSIGSETTQYEILVDSLSDSLADGETVLSSLNYECLLEEAMSDFGHKINYFPDELGEAATVLKPHGSCNFLSQNLTAQGDIQFSEGVSFSGGVEAVSRKEVIQYHRGNNALYPAMALFRPDKYTQVGTSVIQSIQGKWKEAVQQSDKVGIIGVNPRPSDDHLWEPLSNTDAEIFYIGGEDSFDRWTRNHRDSGMNTFISNRFHEGVSELTDELQ